MIKYIIFTLSLLSAFSSSLSEVRAVQELDKDPLVNLMRRRSESAQRIPHCQQMIEIENDMYQNVATFYRVSCLVTKNPHSSPEDIESAIAEKDKNFLEGFRQTYSPNPWPSEHQIHTVKSQPIESIPENLRPYLRKAVESVLKHESELEAYLHNH